MPIQSTILAWSVECGNTVSGGAAIRISLRIGSVSLGIARCAHVLALGGELELFEGARPHRLDVGPDLREAVGSRSVPAARAVASFADQPGGEQDPQVLRDGLARDVEPPGDFARGPLLVGEQCEHFAAARLGERLEDVGHRAQVYTCASRSLPIC
jgi:hypothetical protein